MAKVPREKSLMELAGSVMDLVGQVAAKRFLLALEFIYEDQIAPRDLEIERLKALLYKHGISP